MSQNEKLSQEEIDALLNRPQSTPQSPESAVSLTPEEQDGVGEIGNISFGSAATALSTLLAQRVEITTPEVRVQRVSEVQVDFPKPYVVVTVEYTSGLRGMNALAIEINDAKVIADLMMGGDGTHVEQELNELHLSAVSEAMNQMMGGSATAMATMFQRPINISPPNVKFVDFSTGDTPDLGDIEWVVNTSFRLRIGQLVDSRIMQWVSVPFAKEILRLAQEVFHGAAGESSLQRGSRADAAQAPESARANGPEAKASSGTSTSQQMRPSLVENQASSGSGGAPTGGSSAQAELQRASPPQPVVQRPQFQEFESTGKVQPLPRNLSLLFDVQLTVTVELGRTKRPIREILEMAPGSVLELDKLAGEPVDILVNNKRVAIGEVVVIDENFGVRVTDILSQADRVRTLQS